jgi:hypothetical protein
MTKLLIGAALGALVMAEAWYVHLGDCKQPHLERASPTPPLPRPKPRPRKVPKTTYPAPCLPLFAIGDGPRCYLF